MSSTCEHKALIGCALTAVPGCCACSDKRPHAAAYPTYIDGRGMRAVGKRWQRYCWKCRDYWHLQSTTSSTGRATSESVLPSDQSAPQSASNMDGRRHTPFQVRDVMQQPWSFDGMAEALPPIPARLPAHGTHAHVMFRDPQRTPVTEFRPFGRPPDPDLDRTTLRNPLSLNRENVSPHNSSNNTIQPSNSADPSSTRVPQTGAEPPRLPVYPLGTREEVQSEDYVSPLASMYGRAWNRYREAEERRAAYREQAAVNDMHRQTDNASDILSLFSTRPPRYDDLSQRFTGTMEARREVDRLLFRERFPQTAVSVPPASSDPTGHPATTDALGDAEVNPIDLQASRPPPLSSEELTASIECRICHEQRMDTLLEPCMHLAICHWCSEVMQARVRQYRFDRENGDRRWRCPICRRNVTRARKIYLSL